MGEVLPLQFEATVSNGYLQYSFDAFAMPEGLDECVQCRSLLHGQEDASVLQHLPNARQCRSLEFCEHESFVFEVGLSLEADDCLAEQLEQVEVVGGDVVLDGLAVPLAVAFPPIKTPFQCLDLPVGLNHDSGQIKH